MTVVMRSWSGRNLIGTHLCDNSFRTFGWSCSTTGGFSDCFRIASFKAPLFITESCYSGLSDGDKTVARSRAKGCVRDSGYYVYTHTSYGVKRYKFDPAAIIPYAADDPCKDVSCPDKCVGVDKYDQVCQDGICVRGTLIETNSEHCGYTPEPTPDPTPTPSSDMYIIVALMLAGTYIILRR